MDDPAAPECVARGAAAGAFAAMVPLFGAHLLLAAVVARALRGSVAAALACCLVIGNPLTHLVVVPLAFALGHLLLPAPPAPGEDWLPPWIAQAIPLGEEALAGGVVLGAAAAGAVFWLVRRLLARRCRPGGAGA